VSRTVVACDECEATTPEPTAAELFDAGFVIATVFQDETIDGEAVYNSTTTWQCRHLAGVDDDEDRGLEP